MFQYPINLCYSLPALHQKFDLPAQFVLHTDCPHYWRYHLPGWHLSYFSDPLNDITCINSHGNARDR